MRPAVALNALTETGAMVAMNAAGSLVLGLLGLPVAFVLNAASYLIAAAALHGLRHDVPHPARGERALAVGQILPDLRAGLRYLHRSPALLHPLLSTLLVLLAAGPLLGILPALVQARGGSIVTVGLLGAAMSGGSVAGALLAGACGEGRDPGRTYALLSVMAALAVAAFAALPLGVSSALALAVIGGVVVAEAVEHSMWPWLPRDAARSGSGDRGDHLGYVEAVQAQGRRLAAQGSGGVAGRDRL